MNRPPAPVDPLERPAGWRPCHGTNKAGNPCGKQAIKGRDFCRNHGGRALAGSESPSLKHGRYSKYLPPRLAERAAEAAADPNLVSLRDELALLDALTQEALAGLDAGGGAALWYDLRRHWRTFERAMAAGDLPAMREAVGTISELVGRGVADANALATVRGLIQDRRRVARDEVQRERALDAHMTAAQAMLLAEALAGAALHYIRDAGDRAAFHADLARLVGLGAGAAGSLAPPAAAPTGREGRGG